MVNFSGKKVWLSWHDHPRSRGLSDLLDIPFKQFSHFDSGMLRHVVGFIWAFLVLGSVRPRTIFLQNSFLLLLACAVYKRVWFGRKIVIINDCHNKSLKRQVKGFGSLVFRRLKQWSFDNVDCVIVSNSRMLPHAKALCDCVSVLRDPLREQVIVEDEGLGVALSKGHILFVCSFEKDEPVDAIKYCVAELSSLWNTHCIVMGRSAEAELGLELSASPLVSCPGFLPYNDYWSLLKQAAAVVVLTTDDDCLVCGGYEAMSAERPLVLSDFPVLRHVFGGAAVYTPNEGKLVADAVLKAMTISAEDIIQAKVRFNEEIQMELAAFEEVLTASNVFDFGSEKVKA